MNVNYVYWDIDTTDWDGVNKRYKPLFNRLDLGSKTDIAIGAGYFREMTKGLIDNHLSISFMDSLIIPANQRLLEKADFRKPVSFLVNDQNYMDSGAISGVDYSTDPNNPQVAITGTIGKDILFFGCNRFSLSASFNAGNNNEIQSLLNVFFANLRKDTFYKGIILDLRDNPGGDLADLDFFCGQFIGQAEQLQNCRGANVRRYRAVRRKWSLQ